MPELFQVVTIAEANARLSAHLTPLTRCESLSLHEALDRVLAEELRSPVDLPAFPRSTMDGFAVRAVDTYGASESLPAYLTLCGEVPMGRAPHFTVGPGQAALIHTGGMLPAGSDSVVMIEHTQYLDATTIEVARPVAIGENVIPIGEDVKRGELLFPRGHRLRPQDLGGLAGVGIVQVPVVARPRVAILASGDEVVPADAEIAPGQVRDINSYTIAALARRAGGEPILCGIAPDDPAVLAQMARAALEVADLLVLSAGSSVSARDHTVKVIESLGAPGVLVHGVAIHPGKPTIIAAAGNRPIFGLPGNPVSAMIAFGLFVAPALRRLQGMPDIAPPPIQAVLTLNIASKPGREDFVPVRLHRRDGTLYAEPVFGKSNLIYTMAHADGLVRVPLDLTGLYAGATVEVTLF
ncbi:gephyrin-like molybdotransferase Glp [Chloroflexus sp.]|uniref:molybdopterin molybdotransferase MoeA n=1 Tax=Chloroflexus sp. TaxID=1904827 RepID=UPI00298EF9C5|nr:gephyrin-like molybdotransferase Glp [Chloroflexus sp.]MCS6888542.1 molybdopterin molybdotransferase MoeA [Chloroflexus sp.]MDW8405022.1 molybdopterin molybdotransferase MoeA [Chloroflexus sp.]